MTAAWQETETGFRFTAGTLVGQVHSRSTVHAHLDNGSPSSPRLLELKDVQIDEESGTSQRYALPANNPYVQGNAAIVPLQIAADVGASASARFLAEDAGLLLEITAQMNRPVSGIQASVLCRFANARIDLPFVSGGGRKLDRLGASLVKVNQAGASLAIFADIGDDGFLELSDNSVGPSLTYTLFRQPLEKGVILVGRIAVTYWNKTWIESELPEIYRAWFERDTFL